MTARLHIVIRGVVQGVGFRPFVYRLATGLHLTGWVSNGNEGVLIEVEGEPSALDAFLVTLREQKPPLSSIQSLEPWFLDPVGYESFTIRNSSSGGKVSTLILPDIATCPECVEEIFEPAARRYLYPFTNCTHCGPRFSIIETLPYDRVNTTMQSFEMCPECRREYEDPADRRFHAQPIACPVCGPRLRLWDSAGNVLALNHGALLHASSALLGGEIVAVKSIGGFQLLVDARDEEAIRRLRQRKQRKEKPFAVMFPNLTSLLDECVVTDTERRLLLSPESPIVLLNRRDGCRVLPEALAPGNPLLGAMLPYTPLHHILMREIGFPVVATSGNLSDEPICTDQHEALSRLSGIADLFLVHNRQIVRHVDDSVVRVMLGREMVLRRARGYAPLPVEVQSGGKDPVLAVGAHLKSTVALSDERQVFLSQHIGDLETREAHAAFMQVISDMQLLLRRRAARVVCDLHPDYISSRFAAGSDLSVTRIQHHIAHVASCMADNHLTGDVLGVSWDGTGYGLDGTIWGGEFFAVTQESVRRVATFRSFMLPGGEAAVLEPRRTALGLLYELFPRKGMAQDLLAPARAFTESELGVISEMLRRGLNAPRSSSVGRLFDAVAALLDIRQKIDFEGQAAMELEFRADSQSTGIYPFEIIHADGDEVDGRPLRLDTIDWAPMILRILEDTRNGIGIGTIARQFHNTLAAIIVAIARRNSLQRVVLSGGCFQNRLLTELTVQSLREAGFQPYWHQRVPPNDGGIALGQIVAAAMTAESQDLAPDHEVSEEMEELVV